MRRRLVSIGIVLGVIATFVPAYTSAASAQEVTSSGTEVGSITWGACTSPTLVAFGAECGMLSVPLDYARPSGAKIQLAVSRVVHTSPDEDYQGIMLVNPGGPGGSGLIYSVLGAFVPGDVGSTYDWIGFDPAAWATASLPSAVTPTTPPGLGRPMTRPPCASSSRGWSSRRSTRSTARATVVSCSGI